MVHSCFNDFKFHAKYIIKNNYKICNLFSGGMDSTITLCVLLKLGVPAENIYNLGFDYQQSNRLEIKKAEEISKKLGVRFNKVELPIYSMGFPKIGGLLDKAAKSMTPKEVHVPFRNVIFLSIACAYAETLELKYIFSSSNVGAWDNSPDFYKNFNTVIKLSRTEFPSYSLALFSKENKSAILQTYIDAGCDIEFLKNTLTCYRSSETACGECLACRLRLEAFGECGVEDPLEYAM